MRLVRDVRNKPREKNPTDECLRTDIDLILYVSDIEP